MKGWPIENDQLKKGAAALLFLVFVSAAWVETDNYRVAGLILVGWGRLAYSRSPFRVSIGWMGYACLAWAAYVAIRYMIVYQWGHTRSLGGSEGIYLFPLFYMTLAFILFAYRDVLRRTALLFVAIGFSMALATVDFVGSFDTATHPFLWMNNTIHSSVGAGFVILAAINVAAHAKRTEPDLRRRLAIEALSYATIGVCMIGLLGAKSKGVWAAIAIAVTLQVLLSFRSALGRRAMLSGTVLLAAAAAFVAAFHTAIWKTLSPTVSALSGVVDRAIESSDPALVIRDAIASGSLPDSTNARLKMWYNAVQVWSHNIVFGNGIGWKDLYDQAYYNKVGFDIVHNGYLEIAMRYGLLGLAFFIGLFIWTIAMARRAMKAGLIAPEAFNFHVTALVFFAVTILTNANNRLAIGESYMTAAAAFGFFCLYLIQYDRQTNPRGATAAAFSNAEKSAA